MSIDPLTIGGVYYVNHASKWGFQMRVDSWDDTWISGIVTSGRADAILGYNVIHAGEPITVRRELCHSLVRVQRGKEQA